MRVLLPGPMSYNGDVDEVAMGTQEHGEGVDAISIDARSSDEALLSAWRAGDRSAGQQLLERYYPMIDRFFASKVVEPEELVQETFFAVVRRPETVSNIRSSILGIAVNVLRRHHRRRKGPRGHHPHGPEPVDPSPTREEQLEKIEQERLLIAAVQRLPLDQQLLLELHYRDGMSTAEIEEALGLRPEVVHARLRRTQRKLKRMLAEYLECDSRLLPTVWAGAVL